jgi:ribonuclease J
LIKVIPLGGIGEIGLNMMVFEDDRSAFIVDAGLMFPEAYGFGIDLIIPDISYLNLIKEKLKAIIFTHGHEDHIGAYPFFIDQLGDIPVYGTGFTLGLLEGKLKELKGSTLREFYLIKPGDELAIGSFKIEFIRVCHSIPDCVALAIRTEEGIILHSGDLKIEFSAPLDERTDLNKFSQLASEGVKLLILDATNADRTGWSLSEKEVSANLENLIRSKEGRVIVALFASNIRRIGELFRIAEKTGRYVALVGKSLLENTKLASEFEYLNLPDNLVKIEDIEKIEPSKLLIITTGSQAEPMSSLSLIASGNHKHINVKPGDTIILSSRFITGRERSITHMINNLSRLGAEVFYADVLPVHASGHAHMKELELLLSLIKPEYLLPVHGEYRHLYALKRIAQDISLPEERIIIMENGETLILEDGEVKRGPRVNAGRVFVDGKGLGDVEEVVLRDRRHLAEDGIVVCVMVVDEQTGEIISGPELITKGVFLEGKSGELLKQAKGKIMERWSQIIPQVPLENVELEEEVKKVLRGFLKKEIGRFPVIIPVIIRM